MARLGMFQAPDLRDIRRNKREVAAQASQYDLALEELKQKGAAERTNIAYGPGSPAMITAQTGQEDLTLYNKLKGFLSGNIDKEKNTAGGFLDKVFGTQQENIARPSGITQAGNTYSNITGRRYGDISEVAPGKYSNRFNINSLGISTHSERGQIPAVRPNIEEETPAMYNRPNTWWTRFLMSLGSPTIKPMYRGR